MNHSWFIGNRIMWAPTDEEKIAVGKLFAVSIGRPICHPKLTENI